MLEALARTNALSNCERLARIGKSIPVPRAAPYSVSANAALSWVRHPSPGARLILINALTGRGPRWRFTNAQAEQERQSRRRNQNRLGGSERPYFYQQS